AIRTKSYWPKNQIFRPEDLAAFFHGVKCVFRDLQKCINMQLGDPVSGARYLVSMYVIAAQRRQHQRPPFATQALHNHYLTASFPIKIVFVFHKTLAQSNIISTFVAEIQTNTTRILDD
ncbi:MAG: hypothetical protein MJY90_07080, partial [Bacteroidaceae bacterium]|nr:hypothetical protein [Bacteroidaceae bacterium]